MQKYSIVIPVYNSESWMKKAIDSVLQQTINNWELILIDDGSTDNSLEIIKHYKLQNPNKIKIITQRNSGPAVAREKGILLSTSEYIVFLDSDDFLEKDYLYEIDKKTKTNPDIIIPELMSQDIRGSYYSFNKKFNLYEGETYNGIESFRLTFPWRIHGFACYRREQMVKYATGDNAHFTNYNADEYITRVMFLNSKEIIISKGKYFHTANHESLTKKPSLRRLGFLKTEKKLIELTKRYDQNYLEHVLSDSLRKTFISLFTFKMNYNSFTKDENILIDKTFREFHKNINSYKFNYLPTDETLLKRSLYIIFKKYFSIVAVSVLVKKLLTFKIMK